MGQRQTSVGTTENDVRSTITRGSTATRFLRSAQTHFPAVRTAKFALYNFGTSKFGWRVQPEIALLRRFGPVRLALDIGGNWGQSICALQQCCAPDRIVSFEPNQELAARLRSKFAGDDGVEICSHALGAEMGEFTLYVPRYRNYVYDGLASLEMHEAQTWLNEERMMGFDPAKLTLDRQQVSVFRLDDLNLSPCVVKIDVQGAEEQVVRGGYDMFSQNRPLTIIEAPSERLVGLMREFGLVPYGCEGGKLSPEYTNDADVMFATSEHCARLAGE